MHDMTCKVNDVIEITKSVSMTRYKLFREQIISACTIEHVYGILLISYFTITHNEKHRAGKLWPISAIVCFKLTGQ